MTDDFIPPRHIDAQEDPDDGYGAVTPGFGGIRDEDDSEMRARRRLEQAEQPPPQPPADADNHTTVLSRVYTRIGDAVSGFAQDAQRVALSVAKQILPKPQAYGIECRNGYIIQFTDQESAETLASRRQHLLDTRSERGVELVADGKVYRLMQEYCAALPDNTPVKARELFLMVADALEKQTLFDRLAGMLGSKRAFVAVMGHLPPPPRPPDNYIIVRREQMVIVGHGHRFREPHFIIATPWLSPAELETIFRPGRYVDDAMQDYHDLYLIRRDADTLFRAGHRRLPPPPAISHDQAMRHIYGRRLKWGS